MPAVSPRMFLALASPFIVSLSISACAAPAADPDHGDYGDTTSKVTASCSISREQIIASAGAERAQAIERAFTWYDAQVPYSQSRQYEGYRTDCSGFVSMAWELGQSYTTADFANGGGESFALSGYEELLPGDALVHRSGGSGHIVMFLGWNDQSQTSACVIEQASTASDMQFGTRSTSSLTSGGYQAIRAEKLRDATAGDPMSAGTDPNQGYPTDYGDPNTGTGQGSEQYPDPYSGSDPYGGDPYGGDPYGGDPYGNPAPDPGGVECYDDSDCPYPLACFYGQCG